MNTFDDDYITLLSDVMMEGYDTEDRTSVGMSRQSFGHFIGFRYDQNDDSYSMPFIQSRHFAPRIAFEEWKWMMSGSTDVRELQKKNVNIWNGNSTRAFLDSRGLTTVPDNHIGKAYGYQFRHLPKNDQVKNLIDGLIKNPTSRRHMITVWNPEDLNEMALEPCAHTYNFAVIGGKLNLMQHMRSTDVLFGLPYNFAFGGFWLLALSKLTGIPLGEQIITMTNAHVYENQFEITQEMVSNPHSVSDSQPVMKLVKDIETLDDMLELEYSDFEISGFVSGPKFEKVEMAV